MKKIKVDGDLNPIFWILFFSRFIGLMRKIISFVFKYFKEYSLSGHVKLTLITR